MTFLIINSQLDGYVIRDDAWENGDIKPLNLSLYRTLLIAQWQLQPGPLETVPVIPGYILADDLQGLATRSADLTFIGVTIGLGEYILNLSRSMLAEAESFDRLQSKDERLKYADAMAEIALVFCFAHELAHLQRGHLDWLSVQMAPGTHLDKIETLDLQSLEMDADGVAAAWTLLSILDVKRVEPDDSWSIPEENGYGSRDDAIRLFIGALTLFFLGTVRDRETIGRHDVTSSHPDPLHRFEWSANHIWDLLVEFGDLDAERLSAFIRSAFEEADEAIALVLGLKNAHRRSDLELRETWCARRDVLARWERLREEVSPYAANSLSAPRQRNPRLPY